VYWGSGGIEPCILISALYRGEWSVSRPGRLTPREIRGYPLYRRLGEPQSRSGRGGEEKNSQPLPGIEPPIVRPVDLCYTTELFRLMVWLIVNQNYIHEEI
jgi:hypothetical protein